jgi:hypothetical protein
MKVWDKAECEEKKMDINKQSKKETSAAVWYRLMFSSQSVRKLCGTA